MNERLHIGTDLIDSSVLLTAAGTLDSGSYRQLRDSTIKAALDEPQAIIVDITKLAVPSETALAVFTSARWHIAQWLDVPLLLVCTVEIGRNMLTRNGITRYVPVYPTVREAADIAAEKNVPGRRRVRLDMDRHSSSVNAALQFVAEWLQIWDRPELQATAKVVVTALVDNALRHAGGAIALRLEAKNDQLTVAVEDRSDTPASLHEKASGGDELSSLTIVDAICRAWGCSPTLGGKVVWCVLGPENRL